MKLRKPKISKIFYFANFNVSNEATYWELVPSNTTQFCPDSYGYSKHMLHTVSEANLKPSVMLLSSGKKPLIAPYVYRLKFKPFCTALKGLQNLALIYLSNPIYQFSKFSKSIKTNTPHSSIFIHCSSIYFLSFQHPSAYHLLKFYSSFKTSKVQWKRAQP